MKIERLLKILFYILNRDCVTATTLAETFGVSRRTILRDIDTLTLAGIPIYAEMGPKGGYSIHREYKINEKIIDHANSEYILLALKSLKDIYGDEKVEETYEKIKHIFSISRGESMLEIDLSVMNENEYVTQCLSTLKQAVQSQCCVCFDYTNAQNQSSKVEADLLHVFYKWYAWYVFVYNRECKDFRMYKIVRMRKIVVTDRKWLRSYPIEEELEKYEMQRNHSNRMVCIEYPKVLQTLVEEYFPSITTNEAGAMKIGQFSMKENDFVLFSILLGFGEQVKVLSPPSLALKIQTHLEKTLKMYKNSDI